MRNQQNADARIELARLYHEFGDKDTARLHLDDAIQLDVRNHRAWTARAHLREQEGNLGQALTDYNMSYSLNRFQPDVAVRIASLQRSTAVGVPLPNFNGTRTVNSAATLRY